LVSFVLLIASMTLIYLRNRNVERYERPLVQNYNSFGHNQYVVSKNCTEVAQVCVSDTNHFHKLGDDRVKGIG